MRLQQFLNEARGIRANKINKLFKFIGGDKKIYRLQQIEDIPISNYEKRVDSLIGSNIITVNKPRNNKNVTFFHFISETNDKKLVLIRFSQRISPVQSKALGMKMIDGSESLKMKPQDFKIPMTTKYDYYVKHIKMMVNMLYNDDYLIKEYLLYLIEYVETNGRVKTDINIKNLPLNQIGKNFGEILGPIALFNDKRLYSTNFSKTDDFIIMPTAGNEKLLDYIIKKDDINHNFSAKYKSGAAASLSSIYDIIEKNPHEFTEFQKEVETLKIIMNNSSKEAPVILCRQWGLITEEQYIAWKNKEYNSPIWDDLKNTKKPTATNPDKIEDKPWWILAIMAYMTADYMNSNKFNFNDLILKALKMVSVVQINMNLSSNGKPSFKIIGENINKVIVKVDAKKGYYSTDKPKQKLSFKMKTL